MLTKFSLLILLVPSTLGNPLVPSRVQQPNHTSPNTTRSSTVTTATRSRTASTTTRTASPLPIESGQPTIPEDSGFTDEQKRQVLDGFEDALTIARTVFSAPREIVDPIYLKYFAPENRSVVEG